MFYGVFVGHVGEGVAWPGARWGLSRFSRSFPGFSGESFSVVAIPAGLPWPVVAG